MASHALQHGMAAYWWQAHDAMLSMSLVKMQARRHCAWRQSRAALQ